MGCHRATARCVGQLRPANPVTFHRGVRGMNIVILHRIPFPKIRYDLAIDHQQHRVRYLCLAEGGGDLPASAARRVLDSPRFDADWLARQHADWLGSADRLIARSEYDLLPAASLRERFDIPGDL